VPGGAVTLEALRAGIHQAHAAGLTVPPKPHVWVPQTWAGAVTFTTGDDRHLWFGRWSGS